MRLHSFQPGLLNPLSPFFNLLSPFSSQMFIETQIENPAFDNSKTGFNLGTVLFAVKAL